MIITIGGKPGSGKSTVAKELAKKLSYRYYSIGDLRGQMAMERGLTIDQLNELGEKEAWTDTTVDDYTKKIGQTENNVVIDSWLAWHLIPQAVKIYLDVNAHEAARRIFANPRPDEERQPNANETKKLIERRYQQTLQRFRNIYQVETADLKNYDFIINTTNLTINQVLDKILAYLTTQK